MMKINIIGLVFIALFLTGCTYYQTAPGTYSTTSTVSKFDRSWSAAIGAFSDQGVHISTENRDAGIIQGSYNGTAVSGNINRQADGSVRVQFNTTAKDRLLVNAITDSYNSRMGR